MEVFALLITFIALCAFLGHGLDLPYPDQYDEEYYEHRESGLLEE